MYTTVSAKFVLAGSTAARFGTSAARRSIFKPKGSSAFTTSSYSSPVGKKTAPAVAPRPLTGNTPSSVTHFPEFDIRGKVVVTSGGGQGLGLEGCKRVVQAGAHVHAIDVKPTPSAEFLEIQEKLNSSGAGTLTYHCQDVGVENTAEVEQLIAKIADKHGRLDGLIAAAAIQHIAPITEYPPEMVMKSMNVNFGGVWTLTRACGRQMIKYKCAGSLIYISSMSGFISNRGLTCAVYNASKAAVVQLTRSAAMELAQVIEVPEGPWLSIRVNSICPGNIITPMVLKNFADDPSLEEAWKKYNMMGRLSLPHEYTGAILYLLSDASSFQTGSAMLIDGGVTSW